MFDEIGPSDTNVERLRHLSWRELLNDMEVKNLVLLRADLPLQSFKCNVDHCFSPFLFPHRVRRATLGIRDLVKYGGTGLIWFQALICEALAWTLAKLIGYAAADERPEPRFEGANLRVVFKLLDGLAHR